MSSEEFKIQRKLPKANVKRPNIKNRSSRNTPSSLLTMQVSCQNSGGGLKSLLKSNKRTFPVNWLHLSSFLTFTHNKTVDWYRIYHPKSRERLKLWFIHSLSYGLLRVDGINVVGVKCKQINILFLVYRLTVICTVSLPGTFIAFFNHFATCICCVD